MASDMAIVVVFAAFSIGALFGMIFMVAAAVRAEDRKTMRRENRALTLREDALGYVARGVRRLDGVGLRLEGPHRP